MRKIQLLIGCLLMLSSLTLSANNNMMYDKANQLYHNKSYDSAATLYQQMIHDGYCSADLFYNAGNAYYRINKIGMSIWCYEKAIQIDKQKNYLENLALAKKRIKEPIDEVKEIFFIRWWQSLYQLFSSNTWAILALIFFLLSFLILFLKKLNQQFQFSSSFNVLLFILSGCCLLMMAVNSYNKSNHFNAIVIEPQTLFSFVGKRAPLYLSEGIKVKVVNLNGVKGKSNSTQILVELPDGSEGLLDKSAIKSLY